MSGFSAATDALFKAAVESLFDATCDIERTTGRTSNGRFGFSEAKTTIYSGVACSVQHSVPNRSGLYADRLNGRALCLIFVPKTCTVHDRDTIKVDGGDTYEVVGPPHLDGNDDPALTVPCAAASPVVVN